MKKVPKACQKVALLCLGDVGLQGNSPSSCSFKEHPLNATPRSHHVLTSSRPPRGSSGTEKDQVPFLTLTFNLGVPDFSMSDFERQLIFVAQCFKLLGLKMVEPTEYSINIL